MQTIAPTFFRHCRHHGIRARTCAFNVAEFDRGKRPFAETGG
jgi:hypothetical protein